MRLSSSKRIENSKFKDKEDKLKNQVIEDVNKQFLNKIKDEIVTTDWLEDTSIRLNQFVFSEKETVKILECINNSDEKSKEKFLDILHGRYK